MLPLRLLPPLRCRSPPPLWFRHTARLHHATPTGAPLRAPPPTHAHAHAVRRFTHRSSFAARLPSLLPPDRVLIILLLLLAAAATECAMRMILMPPLFIACYASYFLRYAAARVIFAYAITPLRHDKAAATLIADVLCHVILICADACQYASSVLCLRCAMPLFTCDTRA